MSSIEEIKKQLDDAKQQQSDIMNVIYRLNTELKNAEYEELKKAFGCEPVCANCRFSCIENVGSEYNTCAADVTFDCYGDEFLPKNKLSQLICEKNKNNAFGSHLFYSALSDDDVDKILDLLGFEDYKDMLTSDDVYAEAILKVFDAFDEFKTIKYKNKR